MDEEHVLSDRTVSEDHVSVSSVLQRVIGEKSLPGPWFAVSSRIDGEFFEVKGFGSGPGQVWTWSDLVSKVLEPNRHDSLVDSIKLELELGF